MDAGSGTRDDRRRWIVQVVYTVADHPPHVVRDKFKESLTAWQEGVRRHTVDLVHVVSPDKGTGLNISFEVTDICQALRLFQTALSHPQNLLILFFAPQLPTDPVGQKQNEG